jgi:hypothetical protein
MDIVVEGAYCDVMVEQLLVACLDGGGVHSDFSALDLAGCSPNHSHSVRTHYLSLRHIHPEFRYRGSVLLCCFVRLAGLHLRARDFDQTVRRSAVLVGWKKKGKTAPLLRSSLLLLRYSLLSLET